MNIAKLLESQNEDDFKIGIILLAKKENQEIEEILKLVGVGIDLSNNIKVVRRLEKELPIQYKYLKSNNKVFFVGEHQIQYSPRRYFDKYSQEAKNLDK